MEDIRENIVFCCAPTTSLSVNVYIYIYEYMMYVYCILYVASKVSCSPMSDCLVFIGISLVGALQ